MRMLLKTSIVLALVASMSGCQNPQHFSAVQGAELSVTPVTYTYSVTLKSKSQKVAQKELFAYLEENKGPLLIYGADIKWKGKRGQQLAKQASKWLVRNGAPSELVEVSKGKFDAAAVVSVSTTLSQVQVPMCNYRSITNYHNGDDGCHADTLRWQSMLHPDKKLAGQVKTSFVTPEQQ